MTRSRTSARSAGTAHETRTAGYLALHIDDRIERRTRNGAKDRGDISGVRLSPALRGGRVVLECKDAAKISLGVWLAQTEIERCNDDAVAGFIVHKRHGNADPGAQWVTGTVRDLVALITGARPAER